MDDKSLRSVFCASMGCVLLAANTLVIAAAPATSPTLVAGNSPPSGERRALPTDPSQRANRPEGGLGAADYAAQQHIDFADELVERGAVHAAEEEFTKALWVVAQARQLANPKSNCTRDLATALIALDEAEDFSQSVSATALEPDLRMVAVGHRTPILEELPAETPITALGAIQRYYNYARQHLTTAVGNEPAASRALYGLGRLQQVLPSDGPVGNRFAQAKSMTMHLAAVQVDSKNFKSANELGVLLARYGRPEEAKKVLRQSLAVSPTPTAWHNLAKVCETLGEDRMVAHARRQHELLAKQQASGPQDPKLPVRWVTRAAFVASGDSPAEAGTNVQTSGRPEDTPTAVAKTSKRPWHKKLINNLFSKDDDKDKTPRTADIAPTGRRVRRR